MFVRTAMTLNCKCVAIAHNSDHVKIVTKLLVDWVRAQIVGLNLQICPPDIDERLKAAKDARLLLWESQKKRKATMDDTGLPVAKKSTTTVDALVDALLSPAKPAPAKAAQPSQPKVTAQKATVVPEATPPPPSVLPATAAAATKKDESVASLSTLLAEWGGK